MRDERGDNEEIREFRLEGLTLVVAVAVLVVLLAGAFYLGKWVERQNRPALALGGEGAEDPLANVARSEAPADVDATSDFFDTVEEGGQKQLEPGREARRGLGQPAAEGEGAGARSREFEDVENADDGGPFYVQVWAGRDRQAAELLVDKLQKDGFEVRIFSDRVEGDTLFKVRVGGYPSEADARQMSGQLEQKGYRGAWVTKVR